MPGFWFRNTAQLPRPVSPLTASVMVPAIQAGMNAPHNRMGPPEADLDVRIENGYTYIGWKDAHVFDGLAAPDPREAVRDMVKATQAWESRFLPALREQHAIIRGAVPEHASAEDAARDLDHVDEALHRMWDVHFQIIPALGGAIGLTGFLAAHDFPDAAGLTLRLLSPARGRIAALTEALAELGARMEDAGTWESTLTDATPVALVDALLADDTDIGAAFRAVWPDLRDRSGGMELLTPTWDEDPAPLQCALAGGRSGLDTLRKGTARTLSLREATEADVERRLPADARDGFRELLALSRAGWFLHDTHHYYIDDVGSGVTRRAYLRAGRHLVDAGVLRDAGEVAWLTSREVRDALRGAPPPAGTVDARRRAHEVQEATTPPDTLGEPTPGVLAHPLVGFVNGHGAPTAEGADGDPGTAQFTGIPGAPGRVEARVRVIASEADLGGLRPGEVLVCRTTDVSWTTLMARAAAVVTESGGMLSHAAIVSREFGVPAVVSARGVLAHVRTGERVVVDGDRGTVTLLKD